MTRISSAAVNTQLVNRLLQTQERMFDLQAQVNSEKKSQDYAGISLDTQRLLNIENSRDRLQRYIRNNEQQQTRLNVAATALDAARNSVRDFRQELTNYSVGKPQIRENVDAVQSAAFRALRDLEDLLNTEVDGRFLFSGSRANTEPVDFNVPSISSFQSTYDGARVKVPETRDAHLENFSFNNDSNNENQLFIDDANFLQFRRDSDGDTTNTGSSTIRASSAMFANLTAGATITVTNTTSNNGTYTVESVSSDGTTATVRTEQLTDEILSTALTTETPATQVTFLAEADTGGSPARTAAAVSEIAFDATNGTITASAGSVGLFAGLNAGDFVTIGASTSNNFTVQIGSIDGTNSIITIADKPTDITLANGTVVENDTSGQLTFNRSANTIVAANAVFSGVTAGEKITVAGTDENDGTYTVASVSADGRTVTIVPQTLTDEGLSGNTFFNQFANTDIQFTNSTSTIEVRQGGTTTAVPDIFNGLVVGQQFTVTNSGSNNGTFTIASIAADGSSVTVDETVADETDTDGVNFAGSGNSFAYVSGTHVTVTNSGTATPTIQIFENDDTTAVPNAFDRLIAGQTITLTGVNGVTGSFTIASISADKSSIVINDPSDLFTADATDVDGAQMQVFGASGTIASTSYYSGDDQGLTHRVDDDRDFVFDVQANDPAFEKAIRAMKLILQGEFGTEGGLDQNLDRVNDAKYLLNAALDETVSGTAPFGTELEGSFESVEQDIGFDQFLINQINSTHERFIGFLEQDIADVENADPLEAITKLLDDEQALNASYQVFSRIRQLSLTNFL
jgi:flagellar hook-associated protein 3 FlgL